MAVFRGIFLGLVVVTLVVSATLSAAHLDGFNFGSGGSQTHDLFPQFYQSSCPQVNDIVISVLQRAIEKNPRVAAFLIRLHFHDCFAQSGGPDWVLPLGRRDSKTASFESSNRDIPAPLPDLSALITTFERQGLDETDLVALSGTQ
ncbi:hypothetical protein C1H46_025661 [Malus baccata]|uniref:peroxidase n=1 Tax=Malus baccata TaxID=106549 RepID=A0A540LR88_MALBA|nr:hypothetical protein C1H46_025661 [Malus baccata]